MFYKKYKLQRPDVPRPTLEEDPAVSVLETFFNSAIGDLHTLRVAVDHCRQLLDANDKRTLSMFVTGYRDTSDTFKENIEKISQKMEKFPSTYKQTASTRVELKDRIDELKDCFGEIAEKMKIAEKTMDEIKINVRDLYGTTVREILQEYSKRKTEATG